MNTVAAGRRTDLLSRRSYTLKTGAKWQQNLPANSRLLRKYAGRRSAPAWLVCRCDQLGVDAGDRDG
jgi:hypothetical protein